MFFIAVVFSSCNDDRISLGEVLFYPSFLWVDENVTPVTKTFDFDFSQDAKDDKSFAEFQFVDNEGKPVSTSVMQVIMDGNELVDNKFAIQSDVTSKELTFKFTPNAKEGTHQGYLKLVNHKLDRLDSQPLTPDMKVDAFQWTLKFEKVMNPLAKFLLWLAIILVSLLFLWFLVIKPLIYPRIRLNRIELSSKNGYFVNKKINGARLVIFTNQYKPQGWLNKIFTGEIKYIKGDPWITSWELTPKGRKKVAIINLHGKYLINPVTTELINYGEYQLTNIQTKEIITIKTL